VVKLRPNQPTLQLVIGANDRYVQQANVKN
jgi:hypothetical protein